MHSTLASKEGTNEYKYLAVPEHRPRIVFPYTREVGRQWLHQYSDIGPVLKTSLGRLHTCRSISLVFYITTL